MISSYKSYSFGLQCANKRCILKSWACDGDNDCHDGSDEVNCTSTTPSPSRPPFIPIFPIGGNCSGAMFECANRNCVPFWWKCDGQDDCGDGSDELACGNSGGSGGGSTVNGSTTPSTDAVHTCGENHFQCNNGIAAKLISFQFFLILLIAFVFIVEKVIVFGSRGYATVNQIVLRAKTKKTVTVLMVERKAELAVDRRIIALNIAALCRWVAFPMPLSVTDTKTVPTIQTKKDVAD